jgi:hypothetical protein
MNEKSVPNTIDLLPAEHLGNGEATGVPDAWEKLKRMVSQNASPERVCGELARALKVQSDSVALLRLNNATLMFLYPSRLRTAGTIPISSPAVAARTASTRTTMLSNTFLKVRHASVFEGIKLDDGNGDAATPTPIQKLMSVPIFGEGQNVLGVVQISRKAKEAVNAGPDFTHEDLHRLEEAAALIAKLPWMQGDSAVTESVEGL